MGSFAHDQERGRPERLHREGPLQARGAGPGETKTARFLLEVKKGYKGDTFPLKLAIIDEPLEEFVTEKLELPVRDAPALALEPTKTMVKLAREDGAVRLAAAGRQAGGAGVERLACCPRWPWARASTR